MNGLVGALQFLTRIPVRTAEPVPPGRTLAWFPVVGLLLGAGLGAIAVGLVEVVPLGVAASVAVVAGLLVTGAFHEDGLADVADAFGGGSTVEQRLDILKDSRHGTYGVAALCGSIVVRIIGAASIAGGAALFAAFVAAHVLGRAAAVAVLAATPPARDRGLGTDAAGAVRPATTAAAMLAATGVTAAAAGWWAAPLLAGTAIAAAAVRWLALRKIGGVVGDVLGAVEQIVECTVLIIVSGLAAHHPIWWS